MSTIIWNEDQSDHLSRLKRLFAEANHFDCAVAFLKKSGLDLIAGMLAELLQRGGSARFFVSLDFCLTDPDALEDLLDMPCVELFAFDGAGDYTFHPKIYHFTYSSRTETLVGSANLTGGGLQNNHECSLHVSNDHSKAVTKYLSNLIKDEECETFSSDDLPPYRERHRIARISRATERRQFKRLISAGSEIDQIRIVLEEYRADSSEHGFKSQQAWRNWAASEVKRRMRKIAGRPQTRASVAEHYDYFLAHFASAIRRSYKKVIASNPASFRKLIKVVLENGDADSGSAYENVREVGLRGMGANWTTELLCALNPTRFAVLNKNSLEGMRMVYPELPVTADFSSAEYRDFCRKALSLMKKLGLVNLRELDGVFSRMYFANRE